MGLQRFIPGLNVVCVDRLYRLVPAHGSKSTALAQHCLKEPLFSRKQDLLSGTWKKNTLFCMHRTRSLFHASDAVEMSVAKSGRMMCTWLCAVQ